MADDTDFHVDKKLENLFHDDKPGLHLEDGGEDDITAENLPEWLIGVIVVIILLIIAFFVMVLSSIIKNKRKNRSATCSDNNSSSNICDDLELGKIDQVDPRYSVMTCIPEGKNPDNDTSGTSPEEEFMSNSRQALTEASSSSVSNDGSQSLCGCRNPLFVDDEPEVEKEQDSPPSNDGKVENQNGDRCKLKGRFNKQKNSKSMCQDLKSVDEAYDEEKLNNDLTRLNQMKETENSDTVNHADLHSPDVATPPDDGNQQVGQVLVHHPHENTESENADSLSATQPSMVGDPVEASPNVDLKTNDNVLDSSLDTVEKLNGDDVEKKTFLDVSTESKEENSQSGVALNGDETQSTNTSMKSENSDNSKSTSELELSNDVKHDPSKLVPNECNNISDTDIKQEATEVSDQNGHQLICTEEDNEERAYTKL